MIGKLVAGLWCLVLLLSIPPASAWIHGSGFPPIVNLVGGNFDGCGGEWCFRNLMKLYSPQLIFWKPDIMDVNGYPVTASLSSDMQGQISTLPASQVTPSTTWVWKWTGKAGTQATVGFGFLTGTTIVCQGVHGVCGGNFVNGSTTSQTLFGGTNGRVEFTFTGAPTALTIKWITGANFDGTLSNLILCRLSDEAGLDAAIAGGDLTGGFNPDFIAVDKALRPKILRGVNYNNVNSNTNLNANVAQQIPEGALSYYNHFDGAAAGTIYAGNASGTNAYSITRAGPLVDGYTVQVKFVNASTGSPTFSIDGGTTNIPITNISGDNVVSIGVNQVWTLCYNSLLNTWLSQNGDVGAGIPVSVMVKMANTLGADLWYNIPPHFTDAAITSISGTIKGSLTGSAWYEFANEVWNFGYSSTGWARNMGAALSIPTGSLGTNQRIYGYYSLRVRQAMSLVTTAYGANTKYRRVLANATYDATNNQTQYRLNGTDLNPASNSALCIYLGGTFSGSCSGAPNYSAFPNRAVDFSDAIAYAPYYQGAQLGQVDGDYTTTFLQTPKNIGATGTTNTNPVHLGVSSHGYTTGQRIFLTAFSGGWASLNSSNVYSVTVIDANTISVPFDATGFAAYSSNGGTATRTADELTILLGAADNWALGNFATALTALDGDIRAGTNYGVGGTATIAYDNATMFPAWETVVASYDGAGRPSGMANLQTVMYENAMAGSAPSAAVCTTMAISASYCGATGKIANLLGVNPTPSANSYKNSAQFQATVLVQLNDFMAFSHSAVPAWSFIAGDLGGNQWQLYVGDIYSPPWSSYNALTGYHFP